MNGKTVQMWRQWWCVVRGIMWALLVFPPDSQTTLHPMAATQFSHHYIITGRSAGRLQAREGGSLGARCPFSSEVVRRNGCSKLLLLFSWDPLTPESHTKLAFSQDSIMWDRNLDEMHCVVLWASELGKIGRVSKLGQNVCQGHSAVNHLA